MRRSVSPRSRTLPAAVSWYPISSHRSTLSRHSALQHLWAEFSEKLADVVDPEVKYGGGPQVVRELLSSYTSLLQEVEATELQPEGVAPDPRWGDVNDVKRQLRHLLENAIVNISRLGKRSEDAVSD